MTRNLIDTTPEEAVEMFMNEKQGEYATATLRSYQYRLNAFCRWCRHEGIGNLNSIDGRDLYEFKHWRQSDGDLSQSSWKTQIDTVRTFLHFCEGIDALRDGVAQKLQSPKRSGDSDHRRYRAITEDMAEAVLNHLHKFEYGSAPQVQLRLMWRGCLRVGACRAIDLRDVDLSGLAIRIRHRPSTDTPLKNKERGERDIGITPETADILSDYIDTNRPEVSDDHSRAPLLASTQGRRNISTLRSTVYRWTRPCVLGLSCPEDREPEECRAAQQSDYAYECPTSINPHAIRRGAITYHLSSDVPKQVVSDRADVGVGVLDEHYDVRTEREKMEQRRRWLDNV